MRGHERIVSMDPGLKTGLALLERRDNDVKVLHSIEANEAEVAPWLRSCMQGWDTAQAEGTTISVVYEKFTITMDTARKTQAPWSLEMIGVMKQVMRDVGYNTDLLYGQRPGEAKSVVDNKKLQRLELWHRGGAGHANDAIRHAVLNLITRGWTDPRFFAVS